MTMKPTGKTLHMTVPIAMAESIADLSGMFNSEGKPMTDAESRAALQELRDAGFTDVPACDDHDETGKCRGHQLAQ